MVDDLQHFDVPVVVAFDQHRAVRRDGDVPSDREESREKGVRRADVKGAALLLLQDASVPAPAPEEAPSGGANRFLGLLSLFATIAVASCGAGCAVRRCLKQCEEGK